MIREVAISDEAALSSFFEENNRPEVTNHFHPFPLNAENAHRICAEPRRDRYFAAWNSNSIVGLAMLRGWDEGYDVPSFGIIVDHRHHGRGHGRALTEYAIALAGELRSPRVRLTVHSDNTRAVTLYRNAGFQPTETLPDGRLVMFAECK